MAIRQSVQTGGYRSWEWLSISIILLVSAGLRFYELGQAPLWLDEQCQLSVASQKDISSVWEQTRYSGPIGRASYLDSAIAWRMGARTRAGFRLPQVFEGIGAVFLTYFIGRRWISRRAGLIAAGLLAASGLHILYSRDARGYALFVFLSLLLGIVFDWTARRPGRISAGILGFVTFLAMAVHPLTAVFVFGLGLGALLAINRKGQSAIGTKWIVSLTWSAVAIGAGVIAWYVLCQRQMVLDSPARNENVNSVVYDVFDTYKALIGGYWGIGSYFVFLAGAFGIWTVLTRAEWRWAGSLCIGVSVAAAISVVLSHMMHSYVVPRYSAFALPYLFFLAGAGIDAALDRAGWKVGERFSFLQAMLAPGLMLALLGGMWLQGRSPYDLEKFKRTDSAWPTLKK